MIDLNLLIPSVLSGVVDNDLIDGIFMGDIEGYFIEPATGRNHMKQVQLTGLPLMPGVFNSYNSTILEWF